MEIEMNALPLNPPGAKAGMREWIGLAVLALPTLLVSIDVSVVILALPHIGASLQADSTQQLWIVDIYSFLLAGFLVTMGTLGDRVGRRKLLMIGGAGFAVASVLAAFSTSPEMLIVSRALLGIAGATLSPSVMALITNMFRNDAQRGFAISVWLTCFMGGMVVGPLVGGVLIEHFWWGSVFLLGVPVMLLLLATAPFLLPEYKAPQAGRIDLLSVLLSLLTILPAIYGLKEIAKHGADAIAMFALAAGIGFGILFARRQTRLADPLLDITLFANPLFSSAVTGMFMITVTGAMMLFINQYLQLVLGLSPLVTGLWTLPGVLGSVVGFLVAPLLAAKVKPSLLIGGGLLLSVVGVVLLGVSVISENIYLLAAGFTIWNIGCAPMVTLAAGIVLSVVPPEKAGSGAAINETFSEFGFALGIAAFGSLGAVLYRSGVADGLVSGLTPAQSAIAGDSLAGAVAVVAEVPAAVGEPLLDTARTAFLAGFGVVTVMTGVVLAAVAVLAFVMFRKLPPLGGSPEPEQHDEQCLAPAE
jgi:DHA2 family multidrug resistance protein-like MFS transporter